eukprot:TRINITY_DN4186_c0_g1_i1.p1 TRINITY_DN4186_c0_g1~~TRINITY_DN4186_c0_g1_i1.p1  ORF type:complete len:201 (-),score=22.15 TRINITY_DN4186_c0_g1_i1:68-640(-)
MSTQDSSAAAPKDAEDVLHTRCESRVTEAIKKNPFIGSLIFNLNKSGCDVTREFFTCRPCKRPVQGFYDSRLGITMCENYLPTKGAVEDVLMHELVHAYDNCRVELDTSDCVQVACAEIRAASMSGECRFSREIMRGQFRYFKHVPDCVKRRAVNATSALPHCKPVAEKSVQKAWQSCYNDYAPFSFPPN